MNYGGVLTMNIINVYAS